LQSIFNGVGDDSNFLARLLGGSLGAGLITRIVRGYTFISRNYQAGDKIYLLGFSRGAYTARALAGLISAKGLLPADLATADDKEGGYRLGSAVWYAWRRAALIAQSHPLDHFEEIVFDLPHFLHQPPDQSVLVPAPIEGVAVWDTVGALGIPMFNAQHVAVDVFQFADTALSANVKHGRHAISIDELREDFTRRCGMPTRPGSPRCCFPARMPMSAAAIPPATARAGCRTAHGAG
jgi:hypothetical protein